jgi:hypothetical protein
VLGVAACSGGSRPEVTAETVVTHPLSCTDLLPEFRDALKTHPQGIHDPKLSRVRCQGRFGYAVATVDARNAVAFEVLYVKGDEGWVATDVRGDITQTALRAGVPQETIERFKER